MIFSKKIYKLISGKNISIFAEDNKNLSLFIYENAINKYSLELFKNIKSTKTISNLSYNHITKLNKSHSCTCYDKNFTIIENEKQNI